MRNIDLKGSLERREIPEIETILVMKQVYASVRYRYRIASDDLSQAALRAMPGFIVKWSSNMTDQDKAKVKAIWGDKIIKENV